MIRVHKFQEMLEACVGQVDIPDWDKAAAVMRERLKNAECFDFGEIHLERVGAGYKPPALTNDELAFLHDGLIPVPAPLCWYEFKLPGYNGISGILIDDQFTVSSLTLAPDWIFYVPLEIRPAGIGKVNITGYSEMNPVGMEEMEKEVIRLNGALKLAMYFTLMINSKSTEIRKEIAPVKLNAARAKKGVPPLRGHTIVTIVPEKYLRASQDEAKGTHRSPRLHWRRSHLRTIEGKDGCENRKVVVARCLVGKRELGEVSHEYRVKNGNAVD